MSQITLKNGIRAYLIPVEGTKATTTIVMSKVGSRHETEALSGASHYIEHLMFKGSTALPTPADVARALDAIGADYNAFTSKEYTGYYVKSDSAHEQFAIKTLYDMTFDSLYKEEEMNRERGVIIEEINMYEDTPTRHIEDLLEGIMFEGNTLGWEIAGTVDSVKNMNRDEIIAFRDKYYTPNRMVIAVAGAVDENTESWLNETFGKIQAKDTEDEYKKFDSFASSEKTPIAMKEKKTEQVHLGLGFPGVEFSSKKLHAMKVLMTILGGNMSSRLFMSVREKGGLAYRISSHHSEYEDTGIVAVLAGLDKSRLKEALDRIFIELEDLKENGPTDEEMQRTKQYIKGHITMAIENSTVRAEWFARRALFTKKVETPEERIAAIEAITKEEVQNLAKETFIREKMTMSYIGPETDPEKLRDLLPNK